MVDGRYSVGGVVHIVGDAGNGNRLRGLPVAGRKRQRTWPYRCDRRVVARHGHGHGAFGLRTQPHRVPVRTSCLGYREARWHNYQSWRFAALLRCGSYVPNRYLDLARNGVVAASTGRVRNGAIPTVIDIMTTVVHAGDHNCLRSFPVAGRERQYPTTHRGGTGI